MESPSVQGTLPGGSQDAARRFGTPAGAMDVAAANHKGPDQHYRRQRAACRWIAGLCHRRGPTVVLKRPRRCSSSDEATGRKAVRGLPATSVRQVANVRLAGRLCPPGSAPGRRLIASGRRPAIAAVALLGDDRLCRSPVARSTSRENRGQSATSTSSLARGAFPTDIGSRTLARQRARHGPESTARWAHHRPPCRHR